MAILAVLLAGFLQPTLFAQDIVYFDELNPPYMYGLGDSAAGMYPAMLRAIYAKLGLSVRCVAVPWVRALAEVRKNPVGIGGLYKNAERERIFDFTDPLSLERLAVYTVRSSSGPISSLADLAGLRVGVIRGWSYGGEFDQAVVEGRFTTEENVGDSLNFQKLANGRLDAVISVIESGDRVVDQARLGGSVWRGEAILSLEVFVAFKKGVKTTAQLSEINQAIADLRNDGTLGRIEREEAARGY